MVTRFTLSSSAALFWVTRRRSSVAEVVDSTAIVSPEISRWTKSRSPGVSELSVVITV
jgi:hypothetical protein